MVFSQIYVCPHCGDVWDVELIDMFDDDHGHDYFFPFCRCGSPVRPKLVDGKPVQHALTDQEMEDELWGESLAAEHDDA